LAALLENMFDDRATVSESRADHYIEKERGRVISEFPVF
jgi:hypothetical protein